MQNEKRLIDANALRTDYLKKHRMTDTEFDICYPWWQFSKAIANAPTVDAVEVVHGEWEITEDDYHDLVEMKCSVCGESYGFEDYEDDIPKNYHYCPNCGAKMDGDGNG